MKPKEVKNMEECPIITVDKAEYPTSEMTKDKKENVPHSDTRPGIKFQENRFHSQKDIKKGPKKDEKRPHSPGSKALSIKLRELRRSSNYSQSIGLRRLSHYDQASRLRRSSQCIKLDRSRRSLHYSQSTVTKTSTLYTHSTPSRRTSYYPNIMK